MLDLSTPEERREQMVSFVYGNLAIDNPNITKDEVRKVVDEMHGEPAAPQPKGERECR